MGTSHVSEYETLKDIVGAGRNREGTALDITGRAAPYSYNKFCTNIWKAGNLLGHYGVHTMGELAVAIGPKSVGDKSPDSSSRSHELGGLDAGEPLLAAFGGMILGAVVDVVPDEPVDAPALVAPAQWQMEAAPGCRNLAYGGPPEASEVIHFERSVWSENPIEPPEQVTPDDEALRFANETWTHEELLMSVSELVSSYDISTGTTVMLEAPLTEPGAFTAGILAPFAVGATVVIPENQPHVDNKNANGTELEASTRVVTAEQTGEKLIPASKITDSMREIHRQ
ncbi:hypothetical protein ACFQJ7_13350 [Halovenus rubra]|uniref:AMP-binding enzyme n=2 Tax=Halovenus rubra TaxID=869890 RepID=A0ABD5XB27_9EURY|nr:hypothetical protein [Halovenus rubra]